jgi:very-short-patch-repair endonuclease
VIVELDGWDFHRQREAFEDDRDRDAEHLKLGLVTVRITKTRFENQPGYEAARLIRILRRAGWQPA